MTRETSNLEQATPDACDFKQATPEASDLEQATRLETRSASGTYLAELSREAPPETLKNYEQLLPAGKRPPFNFWNNIERRPLQQRLTREPSAPVLREWTRFRPSACFDDPFVDAARALILLDTYGYPAAYQRYRGHDYLAPNLDTSAWFHHFSPACEWLLIDHECSVADRGLMGVDGAVWDTDGRLLATGSAQLCCIPNPP